MKKTERKRMMVTPEFVRQNAAAGNSGDWFKIPDGVREWVPEKPGTYPINILPYTVSIPNHPEGVKPDYDWYQFPFQVHHNVGVLNKSVVCPTSFGKPCPICEHRAVLAKNYKENEAVCKQLRAQKYMVYNIEDPDDSDKVALFCMSIGKFAVKLKAELESVPKSDLMFYSTDDKGRTLQVRFSNKTFASDTGSKEFLEATRIDFEPRPAMDDEAVMGRTVALDKALNPPMDYQSLKALWLQLDGTEAGETEGESAGEQETPKGKPRNPSATQSGSGSGKAETQKATPPKEPEVDPSNFPFQEGDRVKFTDVDNNEVTGILKEVDADGDVVVVDDEGDEHDALMAGLEAAEDVEPTEPEADPEADTDSDTPAEPEIEVGMRVREIKGPVVGEVTKIVGDKLTIMDEKTKSTVKRSVDAVVPAPVKSAPTAVAGKKTPAAKDPEPAGFKVGDRVKDDAGSEGTVKLVDGTDIVVKMDTGKQLTLDPSDLTLLEGDAAVESPALAAGDTVTWDDGNEIGKVLQIHKVKGVQVKDTDNDTSWQPLASVVLVPKKGKKK